MNVGFRSTDPQVSADIANALARAYVRQSLEVRTATMPEASDWLAQQVEEQRKLVQASEAALQQYRERHGANVLMTAAQVRSARTSWCRSWRSCRGR